MSIQKEKNMFGRSTENKENSEPSYELGKLDEILGERTQVFGECPLGAASIFADAFGEYRGGYMVRVTDKEDRNKVTEFYVSKDGNIETSYTQNKPPSYDMNNSPVEDPTRKTEKPSFGLDDVLNNFTESKK